MLAPFSLDLKINSLQNQAESRKPRRHIGWCTCSAQTGSEGCDRVRSHEANVKDEPQHAHKTPEEPTTSR